MAGQVREDGKSAEEAHKWSNPVLVFGSAYFFFVGWLYLLGFWGHFDANVFEYLGFNDVLKLGTSHPGTAPARKRSTSLCSRLTRGIPLGAQKTFWKDSAF